MSHIYSLRSPAVGTIETLVVMFFEEEVCIPKATTEVTEAI